MIKNNEKQTMNVVRELVLFKYVRFLFEWGRQ